MKTLALEINCGEIYCVDDPRNPCKYLGRSEDGYPRCQFFGLLSAEDGKILRHWMCVEASFHRTSQEKSPPHTEAS